MEEKEAGPNCWGRLVAINRAYEDVDIKEDTLLMGNKMNVLHLAHSLCSLGRAQECAAKCRFKDSKISKKHCAIARVDGVITLTDLSVLLRPPSPAHCMLKLC